MHGLVPSMQSIAAAGKGEVRRPLRLPDLRLLLRLMAAGSAEAGQRVQVMVTPGDQLPLPRQCQGRSSELSRNQKFGRAGCHHEVTAGAGNHPIGMIRLPTFIATRGNWVPKTMMTGAATTAAAAAPTTKLGVTVRANLTTKPTISSRGRGKTSKIYYRD